MDIGSSNKRMWRGALIPATVFSVICALVSAVVGGSAGLFGAGLASFTVVIFFSVTLLVSRLTKNADPISTMALAMFSYFTKLLLMAGFLIAVTRLTAPEMVDRRAFGASALAVAFAWLAGEVRTFFGLRLELTLPASQDGSQQEGFRVSPSSNQELDRD